jgi:hypothetical protein
VQIAEFLDDEELPTAICDIARRLTLAWASARNEDMKDHSSPAQALSVLRASLQNRVLELIPIQFVVKQATLEQQETALRANFLNTNSSGRTAKLSITSSWAAVPQVLFGAVSDATALEARLMTVGGVSWGCHDTRNRYECLEHISGVFIAFSEMCARLCTPSCCARSMVSCKH